MRGATFAEKRCTTRHTISIHAPHAGCDRCARSGSKQRFLFQSTHPMRGATAANFAILSKPSISIHAPHAGCDMRKRGTFDYRKNFNPRTPCGVRPKVRGGAGHRGTHFNPRTPCGVRPRPQSIKDKCSVFQSTHPMRGATSKIVPVVAFLPISIHAPHAGCD